MKVVMLKPENKLDGYHQRRLQKHGYLYIVTRIFGGTLYEAKSISTGRVCTLDCCQCEDEPDAQEAA